MHSNDMGINEIRKRIRQLEKENDEYHLRKKRIEEENQELSVGYEKVRYAKYQIEEENERYIRLLRNKAGGFSPSLKMVHRFCDTIEELTKGSQNQMCVNMLQDTLTVIRDKVTKNDSEREKLLEKIRNNNIAIEDLHIKIQGVHENEV